VGTARGVGKPRLSGCRVQPPRAGLNGGSRITHYAHTRVTRNVRLTSPEAETHRHLDVAAQPRGLRDGSHAVLWIGSSWSDACQLGRGGDATEKKTTFPLSAALQD
jgi:hypothetical protein